MATAFHPIRLLSFCSYLLPPGAFRLIETPQKHCCVYSNRQMGAKEPKERHSCFFRPCLVNSSVTEPFNNGEEITQWKKKAAAAPIQFGPHVRPLIQRNCLEKKAQPSFLSFFFPLPSHFCGKLFSPLFPINFAGISSRFALIPPPFRPLPPPKGIVCAVQAVQAVNCLHCCV